MKSYVSGPIDDTSEIHLIFPECKVHRFRIAGEKVIILEQVHGQEQKLKIDITLRLYVIMGLLYNLLYSSAIEAVSI